MADVRSVETLTADAAGRVVAAAAERAVALGVPVCIAVTDQAGHLMAYLRMDRAPLLSERLAIDKAWTVAAFGLPTHAWYDLIKDEPALLHGIVKTERLVVFGGGVPLTQGEQLVGAVGVSGGSADQDREIAEAGCRVVEP